MCQLLDLMHSNYIFETQVAQGTAYINYHTNNNYRESERHQEQANNWIITNKHGMKINCLLVPHIKPQCWNDNCSPFHTAF